MYGYVVPEKSKLKTADFVLYRSFYCGMCCQTGMLYGQLSRFTTNYDFAFLAALLHDYASADIVIEEHTCVLNPVKRKAVLQPNPLLERLAAANIMLAYQKADDGVADGDGIKYRAVRTILGKPFRAAKSAYGDIWKVIDRGYKAQRAVESANVSSIDRAADAFASLMRDLPETILCSKTDDNLKGLCYNIGKFVYLADGLDDITDDYGQKRYNPFIAAYGFDGGSRKDFIAAHRSELEFCFASTVARTEMCFNAMKFTQSYNLLKNIVCVGLKSKTEQLLSSDKKLKSPRI